MTNWTGLPLQCRCLHAYLINSSLLLFSEKSECVYGFEKEAAALFLKIDSLLEEGQNKNEIIGLFSSLPQDLTENIYSLAACQDVVQKEAYGPRLEIGQYQPDSLPRVYYVANGLTFSVNYPHEAVYDQLHPVFAHLTVDTPTTHLVSVDFELEGENWQIKFNGNAIAYAVDVTRLALILQENMIIALYQFRPYLIAMHAAAVSFGDTLFIMPAVSGSGKTTLTAALMKEGFSLYSDETSTLDMHGDIEALPFSLNIKEGSWSVLKKAYPSLEKTPFHIRFDQQKVRFLTPENIKLKKRKPTHLLFPKYKEGAKTTLLPLSACDAMNRIKEGGYQLDSLLIRERFEHILNYLIILPKFSLEYSSLPEAIEMIKELAHAKN